MRTLLMGAALICIFGATEVSASIIHIDFSGRAESTVSVCENEGGCGPNENISSNFTLKLSFDSGPGDQLITSSSGSYRFDGFVSGFFVVDQVGTFPIARGGTFVDWQEGISGENALIVSTPGTARKVFVSQPQATGRYHILESGDEHQIIEFRGTLFPERAVLTGAPGVFESPGPIAGGGVLGLLLACGGLLAGLFRGRPMTKAVSGCVQSPLARYFEAGAGPIA